MEINSESQGEYYYIFSEQFINNRFDEGVRCGIRLQLQYEILGKISQAIDNYVSVSCGVPINITLTKRIWNNRKENPTKN